MTGYAQLINNLFYHTIWNNPLDFNKIAELYLKIAEIRRNFWKDIEY